jgi:uncharacterized protein YndB with AHSA1/START domain
MTSTATEQYEFTLTWTFDSPPADVFRAWTDPEQLDWFYNDNNPMPSESIELDLRVGGVWRQRMVVDADAAYYTGGVYREIVPDEKLVFAWGAVDGWPELDPDRLGDSPLVTVTLAPAGEGTEMSVRVELPEGVARECLREWWPLAIRNGWRDTVDRLADALAAHAVG